MPARPHRGQTTHAARRRCAGDTAVASNDVVVERWEFEPLLDRLESVLRSARPAARPKANPGPAAYRAEPAIAVGSVNVDHFTYFGRGRLDLPNEPERTGVDWVMLADGAPVAYRARLASGREWPRVAGADLLPGVLTRAERCGARVGFFGGQPEVHEALREVLATDYPRLQVAGFWAPEREEVDSNQGSLQLADEVRSAGVDLLTVGLGKPRQELWIQRFGARTGARVLLAFGASADFMAGKVERAPQWARDNGLEWAHRLYKEPRRLARRYLVEGPPAVARLLPARRVDLE